MTRVFIYPREIVMAALCDLFESSEGEILFHMNPDRYECRGRLEGGFFHGLIRWVTQSGRDALLVEPEEGGETRATEFLNTLEAIIRQEAESYELSGP